jgi:hypothetical protein
MTLIVFDGMMVANKLRFALESCELEEVANGYWMETYRAFIRTR